MGISKFQESWKKKYDWVTHSPKSVYTAVCLACDGKDLNIKSGAPILERHQDTDTHEKSYKKWKSQSLFVINSNNKVAISKPQKPETSRVLTTEEAVLRAEIIRCLDIANRNLPFAATDGDNMKYRTMFPDSEIAKTYAQGEDKAKYMLQFGIAPVIQDRILADLRGKPFSFRFDETTTSQVKKQYDGYATFFSDNFHRIITSYLGTLFVGKCTADDIVNDLNLLMKKRDLDIDNIIGLGMDGPNVNLLFFEKISDTFALKGKVLIDAGVCPLHTVANAFGKGLQELKNEEIDLDDFAINLHSFFKLSAKRIEQYFTSDIIAETEPQRMIRHSETRWLGIQRVLLRILEQLTNISNYFLKIVPADKKTFNGKKGVGNSVRYAAIKKMITDERLIPVIAAVCFVAQEFKSFTVPLQSRSPLITILFTKIQRLLQGVLSMFVKEKLFMKNNKLRQIKKIQALDLNDKENQKVTCVLGTKYQKELARLKPLEQKKLDDLMKKFLIRITTYLLENLPLDKQVLRDVRVIHPNWPLDDNNSAAAICRLASLLWNALGQSKMIDFLFKLKPTDKECDFVDLIKREFTSFRLESKEIKFEESSKHSKKLAKPSYWRDCYNLAELSPPEDDGYTVDAEGYWMKVMEICNEEGKKKYLNLGLLSICFLLMPHGNADPERGFSINKLLLQRHGFNISEDCIEALRVIKDYLIQIGGVSNVKIDQKMLKSCGSSREKYHAYLDAADKKSKDEAKQKEVNKEAEKKKQTANEIESRISTIQVKVILADAMIEEGNKLLKACVKKMVQSIFKDGQEKVELGVKRKAELNKELDGLKVKKSKL